MALNINGTTGISGVDGSASAPALQGTDSNTGINFASDTVNINTGGTTRATIDSNGRLGIGTTSPTQLINCNAASGDAYIKLDTTVNGGLLLDVQGTQRGVFANDSAFAGTLTDIGIGAKGNMIFRTGTSGYTERMRLDSNGLLGIGTAGATKVLEVSNTGKTNYSTCFMHCDGSDNVRVMGLRSDRASGGTNANMIEFFNSGGS